MNLDATPQQAPALTADVLQVLIVLGATMLLFVTERLRVDVVAVLVLVTLAWLGLVTPDQAFSGLSSTAVISIIGVMILGKGIDASGLPRVLLRPLARSGLRSPGRVRALVMAVAAGLSAFMQNVGAAALLLPIVVRLARQTEQSVSRLLMPMGFAAILGGTLTMIASSTLILLNDLMPRSGLEPLGIFDVTPIGALLLLAGFLYLVGPGRHLLPAHDREVDPTLAEQRRIRASLDLDTTLHELVVLAESPVIGHPRDDVGFRQEYDLHLVAIHSQGETLWAPWRQARLAEGQRLAVLGRREDAARCARDLGLALRGNPRHFRELSGTAVAGFAEFVVPPRSPVLGRTLRDLQFRHTYGLEPLVLLSGGESGGRDVSDRPLRPGDTLVVHGRWEKVGGLGASEDFQVLTHVDAGAAEPRKTRRAALCFLGAIGLAVAGLSLPLALFSGALAMVLTGVLSMDDAYRSVSWRTIFLVAGLIPLGIAVQQSGTAAFVAHHLRGFLEGAPEPVLMAAAGAVTTLFTLLMSNVAATVVMVPLFADFAVRTGVDPRAMVLLVGLCASNSFLLPTHQVNALLMVQGGYRNADYLRVGGALTVLFLLVAVSAVSAASWAGLV